MRTGMIMPNGADNNERDVIATMNVMSLQQWMWRHCDNERDVIATMNVMSLQQWTWRHCDNERDVIATMNVTSRVTHYHSLYQYRGY